VETIFVLEPKKRRGDLPLNRHKLPFKIGMQPAQLIKELRRKDLLQALIG
jgi:hypothetical protein